MVIRFLVVSFVFLLCVTPLHTRADASSAARLSPVIARALSYERTLPSRAGGSLDILIVHAANNAASAGEAAAFARGLGALSRSTVQGLPMRATVAPYSTAAIEAGEASVAADPTDAEAWLLLGAAYDSKGRPADARRAYQSCMQQGKRGPKGECAALLR